MAGISERTGRSTSDDVIRTIAGVLLTAERKVRPIKPLSARWKTLTPGDAYAIQAEIVRIRLAEGARLRGHKVGLTSVAMQELMGIDEPDYGHLFDDMFVPEYDAIEAAKLCQPRVEAELAFVLRAPLDVGPVTVADVASAIDFVLPALEIIDSRVEAWRIGLVDTIADNGSSGRVVLGGQPRRLGEFDIRLVPVIVWRNGNVLATGASGGVLGNPLTSVAWLANAMLALDSPLEKDEIVLSGSATRAVDARPGDNFHAEFGPLGSVVTRFSADG